MLEVSFLVGVAFIVVALITLPYWWSTLVMIFTPVRPLKFEEIDASELPPEMLYAAHQAAAPLTSSGFEFVGCMRNRPIVANIDGFQHHFYYLDSTHNILASVTEMSFPGHIREFEITLRSYFSDSTLLSTVDCFEHAYMQSPSNIITQDGYTGDTKKQLSLHRERTISISSKKTITTCVDNIAKLVSQENELSEKLLIYWLASRQLWKGPMGTYINSPVAAFLLMRRFIKGQKRAFGVIGHKNLDGEPFQLTAYGIAKQLQFRRNNGRLQSLIVFVASLVAFMISFGFVFDAVFALLLALVIFIHELGHFIAMRIMGYKNSSIMFLPFIGGVTLGEKDNAKPWQQVVMYLAGPVPGLVVGGGLFFIGAISSESWAYQFLILLVVINLINLLPITPLDGG